MAKTVVQKIGSPDPDVTVFKIGGTLGFHENKVLVKFFEECSSRNLRKLVLDLSELDSLGGGCAKIIRDAAQNASVRVCVAGASRTVHSFLSGKGDSPIAFASDLECAVAELRGGRPPVSGVGQTDDVGHAPKADGREAGAVGSAGGGGGSSGGRHGWPAGSAGPTAGRTNEGKNTDYAQDVLTEVDDLLGGPPPAPTGQPARPVGETWADDERSDAPLERPTLESAGGPPGRAASAQPSVPGGRAKTADGGPAVAGNEPSADKPADETAVETKELKRKLVRYRALFSVNKEFGRIEDKSRLLDAFLLTIVAQVGVESAAFLELANGQFAAVCWKGFETADPKSLNIRCDEIDVEGWLESPEILPIGDAPIAEGAKGRIGKWDLPFAAPFIVHQRLRGIVLLGKPIRRALDADAWEFLSMMFDQVAIAYENSCRLEKESERTLGLVQSLISMIEANTISRGTTEMVMDLTYAVAIKMHYPEEHHRDLLYGTVLRDIGMLSTGSYIVKSPRELGQEEWEVIKQHPAEGAAMLARMNFSEHACGVVRSHHERHNGEGYPDGLTGPQIPLGARILSVVESYAAMLRDRPNRPALTADEALSTLEENWSLRYDPEVVKVFVQTLEEEARTGGKVKRRGIELIRG